MEPRLKSALPDVDDPGVTTGTGLPSVSSTVVNGLQAFRCSAPGPTRAGLVFRTGIADEPGSMRGINHLIEHLVLAPLGQPSFSWNGFTTAEEVGFHCEGTPEQVTWFLEQVCANLRRLPFEHLETQRGLLRAENAARGQNIVATHDLWRWGARGLGLAALPEYGLPWIGPAQVSWWAARSFTLGNACLWTTGEVPALELPPGMRRPNPEVPPRATPLPASFHAGSFVALTAELQAGQWAGVVLALLERRLMARLRYDDGAAYGITCDLATMGDRLRRICLAIDGVPGAETTIVQGTHDVLEQLATLGPTQPDLDWYLAELTAHLDSDVLVLQELVRRTHCHLRGEPYVDPEQFVAQLRAVTPADFAPSYAAVRATSLWSTPPDVEVPHVSPAPQWSTTTVQGTRFRPPAGQLQHSTIDVGDQGITLHEQRGERRATVRWDDCVVALSYDDGARTLVGGDGISINLLPERWHAFPKLQSLVDARVPAAAHSPQGAASKRPAPAQLTGPTNGVWIFTSIAIAVFTTVVVIGYLASNQPDAAVGSAIVGLILSALPLIPVYRRRRGAGRLAGPRLPVLTTLPIAALALASVILGVLTGYTAMHGSVVNLFSVGLILVVIELARRVRTHR